MRQVDACLVECQLSGQQEHGVPCVALFRIFSVTAGGKVVGDYLLIDSQGIGTWLVLISVSATVALWPLD